MLEFETDEYYPGLDSGSDDDSSPPLPLSARVASEGQDEAIAAMFKAGEPDDKEAIAAIFKAVERDIDKVVLDSKLLETRKFFRGWRQSALSDVPVKALHSLMEDTDNNNDESNKSGSFRVNNKINEILEFYPDHYGKSLSLLDEILLVAVHLRIFDSIQRNKIDGPQLDEEELFNLNQEIAAKVFAGGLLKKDELRGYKIFKTDIWHKQQEIKRWKIGRLIPAPIVVIFGFVLMIAELLLPAFIGTSLGALIPGPLILGMEFGILLAGFVLPALIVASGLIGYVLIDNKIQHLEAEITGAASAAASNEPLSLAQATENLAEKILEERDDNSPLSEEDDDDKQDDHDPLLKEGARDFVPAGLVPEPEQRATSESNSDVVHGAVNMGMFGKVATGRNCEASESVAPTAPLVPNNGTPPAGS